MNLEQKIKEEIYNYVLKFDLTESEIKEIDTYVLSLLENFSFILDSHDNIMNNEEKINILKSLILENMES
tara:strand:- start:227 stop:436 length:210 start_codon:yes stop_codon:yes gene_type:complete